MWLNIDPHVLLYAFLPLLLFGDAMSINMHVMRRKFAQVLVLAHHQASLTGAPALARA